MKPDLLLIAEKGIEEVFLDESSLLEELKVKVVDFES